MFNFQENTNIHISQVFMSLIVCIFNILELNNHLSWIQTKQIRHNKWIIKSDNMTLEISRVVIIM
jgi:hypothetical protein